MENKLTTFNQTSSSLVSASFSEIATLRVRGRHLRYGLMSKQTRDKFLIDEMSVLIMIRHEDIDEDMLPMEASVLDDYIMDNPDSRDLIPQELDYCFRMGLAGKYGSYYGITPVSLYGFVTGYLRSPKKFNISFHERQILKRMGLVAEPVGVSPKLRSDTHASFIPIPDDAVKLVDRVIESDGEHRRKVRQQAQQILKEHGTKRP